MTKVETAQGVHRYRRIAGLAAARVALVGALGCRAPALDRQTVSPLSEPHPFFVCIAPLPEAPPEAESAESHEERACRLRPVSGPEIAQRAKEELEASNVFTRVHVLQPLAAGEAATRAADLGAEILIEFRPNDEPLYRFSHRSGWSAANSVLWFLLGFPSWWSRDRVYEIDWEMAFSVRYVAAQRNPVLFPVERLSRDVPVSVFDQGLSWSVLVVPPGFYEGPALLDILVPTIEETVADDLVSRLKNAPFQFEDIQIDVPELVRDTAKGNVLEVRSRSAFEQFVAFVDDDPDPIYELRATTMIGPDARSEGIGLYTFKIPLRQSPGDHFVQILLRKAEGPAVESPRSRQEWSVSKTFFVSI